jgi:lysyl-tRNA synthetase class 1
MFWADELAARFDGPQVVNDSKTPSGTVHVGSLRGVVLHDVIHRALIQAGLPSRFLYGVDDLDPMDSQALLTPDAVDRYMGVPLAHVPAPEGSVAESYARYFVGELFMGTFEGLGVAPEVYWMSELYGNGSMDRYIRTALDRAEAIREIYLRVSNVERAPGWLPASVICERCGRIGTTLATDWDGETVAYSCQPDYVTWATGCGNSGRVAPFGGRAKLPFNVDWAAKWSHFGITIEGCGKDLGTKGGSRDRSNAISREVFDREPPINVHYEFLNVGGRKMSTSKGSGAAAHEMADLLPPELIRFLFLRHKPKKALDFDPGGDAIPGLFDEFDRLAAATAGQPYRGELPADHERIFRLSLVDPAADMEVEAHRFRPAFRHLTMLVQVPAVDLEERVAAEKGAPLDEAERAILAERAAVARAWLDGWAPERYQVSVRDDLPAETANLSEVQGLFLAELSAGAAEEHPVGGDAWQDLIYRSGQTRGVSSRDAFAAVYAALLGRASGPRAGWLLASLDEPFVVGRLREAAHAASASALASAAAGAAEAAAGAAEAAAAASVSASAASDSADLASAAATEPATTDETEERQA